MPLKMLPTEKNTIDAEACFSKCGKYRYWLSRIWDKKEETGAFICINPSKASALKYDTTLSNCSNLAVQWGWGGFYMLNLFSYIATDQADLQIHDELAEAQNDLAIKEIITKVDKVVLAWGNNYRARGAEVLDILGNRQMYCIQMNAGGGYRHPCRIRPEEYSQPTPIKMPYN